MNCQLCGNEVGIISWFKGERDFCSSSHRARFQAILGNASDLVREEAWPQIPAHGPLTELAPMVINPRPAKFGNVEYSGQHPVRMPPFAMQPVMELELPGDPPVLPQPELLAFAQSAPVPFYAQPRNSETYSRPRPVPNQTDDLVVRLDVLRGNLQRAAFLAGELGLSLADISAAPKVNLDPVIAMVPQANLLECARQ